MTADPNTPDVRCARNVASARREALSCGLAAHTRPLKGTAEGRDWVAAVTQLLTWGLS